MLNGLQLDVAIQAVLLEARSATDRSSTFLETADTALTAQALAKDLVSHSASHTRGEQRRPRRGMGAECSAVGVYSFYGREANSPTQGSVECIAAVQPCMARVGQGRVPKPAHGAQHGPGTRAWMATCGSAQTQCWCAGQQA
jgi:hypothetical protein